MMCVGTRIIMSTSVEHEFTKRALESIPQVSSRSNPDLIPFACFASFMLVNCSFLWFDCKHVDGIISPCDIHVSSLLDNDALCVATKMLNIFSFRCFVCNHISFKSMYCHESFQESRLVVATNIRTTCSFIWFVCKHNTFVLDMLPCVFLPNSPILASKMLFEIWIQCFECPTSMLYGVFEFPHLDDVQTISMHIDHAYAFRLLYLSCANSVVKKNGHATFDMIHYHA